MVQKRQPLLLLLIFVRTTCVPRRLQGAYTQVKFTATDAAPESYFGASVALDGDVLAVAATGSAGLRLSDSCCVGVCEIEASRILVGSYLSMKV